MLTREEIKRRINNIHIALTSVKNRLMLLRDELKFKESEHIKLREELMRYEKMLNDINNQNNGNI